MATDPLTNQAHAFQIAKTAASAYTCAEMQRVIDEPPTRGPVCPKCGAHIPQFVELNDSDRFRILKLICENRNAMATQELVAATRCPISWAKIWVIHSGRPDAIGTTAPCPYCGKQLKTALAKQCQHCNMDWHDEEHPRLLK